MREVKELLSGTFSLKDPAPPWDCMRESYCAGAHLLSGSRNRQCPLPELMASWPRWSFIPYLLEKGEEVALVGRAHHGTRLVAVGPNVFLNERVNP